MVTFPTSWTIEMVAGVHILITRLTRRLRHDTGLVYDVNEVIIPVAKDQVIVSIGSPFSSGDLPEAIRLFRATLDDLHETGATDSDVAGFQATFRERADEAEWTETFLTDMAAAELLDLIPHPEMSESAIAGLQRDAISAALRAAVESSVLFVPEHADPDDLAGLTRLPIHEPPPVGGIRLRRHRRASVPTGSALVLNADSISLRWGKDDQSWTTVRYSEVVCVAVQQINPYDEVLFITSSLGPGIDLRPLDWRGGQQAASAVRRAVPNHLQCRVPDC